MGEFGLTPSFPVSRFIVFFARLILIYLPKKLISEIISTSCLVLVGNFALNLFGLYFQEPHESFMEIQLVPYCWINHV